MKALFAGVAGAVTGAFVYSSSSAAAAPVVECSDKILPPPPLSPEEFRPLTLMNVYDESPDTKVFRFAFPDGNQDLNMTLCSCVAMRFIDKDGKEVIRPYTPISRPNSKGYCEFMIKNYKGSKMGNHLNNMKVGDTIEVKGPFVKFPWKPGQYKSYGLIAAGTGITPMFQFLREMLKDKSQPEVNLIFANRRKEDVLLGTEINTLMEQYRHFSPYYVLSDPPASWMGGIGHVSKEMIKAFMPPPSRKDAMLLVCGPPKFMETICGDKNFSTQPPSQGELKGLLKELGYAPSQIFKF
jgi:cytochrome-b5 reductase